MDIFNSQKLRWYVTMEKFEIKNNHCTSSVYINNIFYTVEWKYDCLRCVIALRVKPFKIQAKQWLKRNFYQIPMNYESLRKMHKTHSRGKG